MTPLTLDRILVPLDGSVLAEAVLPSCRYFLERTKAQVILLHIVEKRPPKKIHGQRHIGSREEAQFYLEALKQTLEESWPGRIEIVIFQATSNRIAREIAHQQKAVQAGLVILCTHGHSGLSQFWSGSIAQKTVDLGKVPLLMIHPDHPAFEPQTLLIPLDGNPEHEKVLSAGTKLAAQLKLDVNLLLVIPTPGTVPPKLSYAQRMLPGLTRSLLDLEEQEAQAYLAEKKLTICQELELREPGLCLDCEFTVQRGDPSNVITTTVQKDTGNLPLLATHGRTGLKAFWEGSVANLVGQQTKQPLLLFPLPAT